MVIAMIVMSMIILIIITCTPVNSEVSWGRFDGAGVIVKSLVADARLQNVLALIGPARKAIQRGTASRLRVNPVVSATAGPLPLCPPDSRRTVASQRTTRWANRRLSRGLSGERLR
jgi:hypothetical protein